MGDATESAGGLRPGGMGEGRLSGRLRHSGKFTDLRLWRSASEEFEHGCRRRSLRIRIFGCQAIKGICPLLLSRGEGASSGLGGYGKRTSFEGIRWRGTRRRIPLNLVSRPGRQRSGHQYACFSQSDGRFFELSGEADIDSGEEHRSSGKTRPGAILAAAPGGD